jgi:hypothetical protein
MKISLECEIDSIVKISSPLILKFMENTYTFSPNEEGVLSKVKITFDPPKPELYGSRFEPMPDDPSKKLLVFDTDSEFDKSIIEEFQYIEGMLALMGGVKRVKWQAPIIEYLPENEEEKQRVRISSFALERIQSENDIVIPDKDFGQMILRKDTHRLLNVYLSFFREGMNEYKSFRFINAFYNFYFILEGIYGKKQWRNFEVREAFKKSPEYCKFLQEAIDNDLKKNWMLNKQMASMLKSLKDRKGKKLNKKLDVDGITHLIVDTRGALHHYSGDHRRTHGTPFNHEKFESLALITLVVARETIWEMCKEIDEYVEKFGAKQAKKKAASPS